MTVKPDHFPYAHSGEPDLARYLRVRAEGVPLRQAIWTGLSYLRKYRSAKATAPVEELAYFAHQGSLLRRLAGEDLAARGVVPGPRLAMVGDVMWLRDGWDQFLSPGVLEYLNGHEMVLGNLESPISARYPVPSLWPDYFTFNSAPGLVTSFRRPNGRNTFSALGTANNHSLDRGEEGLRDTLAFLDAQGIPHTGVRDSADDLPFVTFSAGGFTVGFYAACWGLNDPDAVRRTGLHIEVLPGVAPAVCHPVDLGRIRRALDGMTAAGVDLKVVGLHWGHEFEYYPCPDLMCVGREVVRAGADLILGTHPHVVQPLEVCFVNGAELPYRERWPDLAALQPRTGCLLEDGTGVPRKALIAHSLGNFATAMYTLHCRVGAILSLSLGRDPGTGRVDWYRPEMQPVVNLHRDPTTGTRRLLLLEQHLRERERAGDRAAEVRAFAAGLEQRVLGPG